MNIAFLYYYANLGGVTSVIKARMPVLASAGWNVKAFFSNDLGGVRELRDAALSSVQIVSDLAKRPSLVFERSEIDVVTVVDMPEVISLLRERFSGPLIYEIHTPIDRVLMKTTASDLDKVDRIFVPSRWSQEWVREKILGTWDRAKVLVVPNVIDRSVFHPASEFVEPSEQPLFVWVGKIAAYKRWRDAARIFGSVSQALDCSIAFVTGGDCNERNTQEFLTELVACGLLAKSSWYHNLPMAEMANLYRECARSGGIVLSTSEAESFCLVAHEAMSCGAPVVAAKAGALPEVYPGSLERLLFEIGNVTQAAEIIIETAKNRSFWHRMRILGLQQQEQYDSETLRQGYLRELREAVGLRRAA